MWKRNRRGHMAALEAFLAGVGWGIPPLDMLPQSSFKPITDLRKCALPGCEVQSLKDYCCADHCRKHREAEHGKG